MKSTAACLMAVATVVTTAATASAQSLDAQQPTAARRQSNLVFVELGGNAGLGSINYERQIAGTFGLRAGIGFLPGFFDDGTRLIPLLGTGLLQQGNHNLEFGLGVTVAQQLRTHEVKVVGTGVLGYRYQNMDNGFTFRASITPLVSEEGGLFWAGISFGYAF